MANYPKKKVLLFLAQGFEVLEASAFIDVMGWTHEVNMTAIELTTVAFSSPVKAHWNVSVIPEKRFADIHADDFDALAIPGGFEESGFYVDAYDERFRDLIRDFDEANKPIASICVAALPLGNAGVLKGKQAKTYDLSGGHRIEQLKAYGAEISDKSIVQSGNLITSVGPSTALDVAFLLVEMLSSPEELLRLKEAMRF